jgi:hypothetical protein
MKIMREFNVAKLDCDRVNRKIVTDRSNNISETYETDVLYTCNNQLNKCSIVLYDERFKGCIYIHDTIKG